LERVTWGYSSDTIISHFMLTAIVCVLVVLVGGYFLARRADVRLVLMLAAAVLFALKALKPESAGNRGEIFSQFFVEFAKGLCDPTSVVPICSAMGFAYVCKFTACDAHLVHLLVRPLQKVRFLLIPGGIAVSFFVNCAIVSQTSTVSVVGPVLIPLLLASGISLETAGALLLLGGSMGGEIMNPAAVEIMAISKATGMELTAIIRQIMPYNLLASGVALVVFWGLSFRHERRGRMGVAAEHGPELAAGSIAAARSAGERETIDAINPLKALVPVIPILLLVGVKPMLRLPPSLMTGAENKIPEQACIAAAMLIGVIAAGMTSPRRVGKLPSAFFEGAGFAFAHVISVITCAKMFAMGIQANGLIALMTSHLHDSPAVLTVASLALPWIMAAITGTAVGTAPLVIGILLPIVKAVTPGATMRSGGMQAIGAQFGRTSSPVAPVVIMCATLSRQRPLDLARRVLVPLVCGGIVLLVVAMWMGST
jgi:C4-dicarboxylate transporter, DcuC family